MSITAYFHCEANERIGFGHLSRCLAWAQAFRQRGAHVVFAPQRSEPAARFVEQHGFPAYAQRDARLVFIDGYHYPDDTPGEFAGSTRVWVDDFASRRTYDCEAVVNFTVAAPGLMYPEQVRARFLGPRYFAARQTLRALRRRRRPPIRKHALVALGGYDRGNYTTRAASELLQLGWDVTVALGPDFPWRDELHQVIMRSSGQVTIAEFQPDIATVYQGVSACVCGGGLTKYECAYMGVPAAVISQTPEQGHESAEFCRRGLAHDLGFGPELDDSRLRASLSGFLGNDELLADMSGRALDTFPDDPADQLASDVIALLQ